MASIHIPLAQIQLFFLIFLRVSIILVLLPIFDSRAIPPILKVGLSLAVTVLVFPLLGPAEAPLITETLPFVLGAFSELSLGIAIGLAVRLIFTGIQMAGQLAGYQMGFAVVNVMDPMSNSQVSIIAQLNYLVAVMIFLSINAHHWFLYALAESFTVIPPLNFRFGEPMVHQIITLASDMFGIAIQIGAPVMVALLLTTVALGLVARTVPQMNVFIVAFPVKIVVGFIFIMLTLPHLADFLQEAFNGMGETIFAIIKSGQ